MSVKISGRSWLAYIGLFIGILGILFSVYTYLATQVYREPVFVVDPSRTVILHADPVLTTPIRVLKPNGEEIKSDLTTIKFFFWNNGPLAIKRDNILRDLIISLDAPEGEIIDYRILKVSREINKCEISPVLDTNKKLKINFLILKEGDGLSGQIMYEGPRDAGLKISGVIEGVPRILTNPLVEKKRFWHEYPKKLLIFVIIIAAICFLFIGTYLFVEKVGKKIKSIVLKKILLGFGTLIMIAGVAIVVFAMILGLIYKPILETKEETRKNIVQYAPDSISPYSK